MAKERIDYDLHGLVGIRLLGASREDAAAVTRQLGPIEAPLGREPDIVIRFVDALPCSSPVRYLDLDDAAFTADAFLLLRGKNKARVKVQIPFDRIGRPCEIVCERRLPAVPLLIAFINLTALAKGTLPLHASAFIHQGTGVLTTGWAKGGKTESLLAFMANGAAYVGDEWIYLSGDGRRMYGIPERIRLWNWHLEHLPRYRALAGRHNRAKLRALKMMIRPMNALGSKAMRRIALLLERQMYVQLPPEKMFGATSCPLVGAPDKIFFVATHDSEEVSVRPVGPSEIARRMVFSLQEERRDLMSYYRKFRFAFPGRPNPLIERAETLQLELLERILADKETYAVYHPYPVRIADLFEAMIPFVEKRRCPQ